MAGRACSRCGYPYDASWGRGELGPRCRRCNLEHADPAPVAERTARRAGETVGAFLGAVTAEISRATRPPPPLPPPPPPTHRCAYCGRFWELSRGRCPGCGAPAHA